MHADKEWQEHVDERTRNDMQSEINLFVSKHAAMVGQRNIWQRRALKAEQALKEAREELIAAGLQAT